MNHAARHLFPMFRPVYRRNLGTRTALNHSTQRPTPQPRRMASYGSSTTGDSSCCYGPTMDDLPVPQGCWFEAHARAQRAYTIWLGAGIVYLAVSVTLAMQAFNFDAYPERHIVLVPEDFE